MTSLQRLLTVALAVALLLPAAAQASSSMETGIADDAALLNEPSDAKAAAAVSSWAALGIDDVRIFVQWQAIAPANSEVKAPDGFNSADPDSPGYDWSRVDRAVSLVSAAGMRPLLVVTGPGPLWASQVPRPPQRALQAAARSLRPVRARRCTALRRGRRPLDHLERAEPAAVAAAAEHVRGQALHAVRPAPLPPARARRLPGDQGSGPHLDRPLRRPRAARRERDEAERAHDAAGLHPLDGVRQGDAQARPQRALQGLQAADRRRLRLPPPCHDARARRTAATPRRGRDRRPAAPRAHARRHPARRRPEEAGRRQVRPVLHRMGLPDASARPDPGRVAGQAVALPAAGRLHRLQGPAREAADPVRVARRAARSRHQGDQVLGLAVRPALRQRQGQAVAEELRQPVLHRPAATEPHGSALGPACAPATRTASPCSAASPARSAGRRSRCCRPTHPASGS